MQKVKNISRDKIIEFEKRVEASRNIVILPHVNPDGDAIGSVLALYIALKGKSNKIRIISPSDYPGFLKWLPKTKKIEIYSNNMSDPFSDCDLIIAADFNAPDRLGLLKKQFENSQAFKVLIDHHPDYEDFADLVFSDINYSSTAELVYDILINSKFAEKIELKCAICLFTGILTDTGAFSFNSSDPNTYKVVAGLLEKGVDKDKIYARIYDDFSYNRMRFLGHVLLNRMKYLPEYRTGYITISAEDRKQYKERIGDTENFVNYPLSVENCVFSAIIIERDNFVKMSFRSKGDFSAGDFAKNHFDGGGHKNASGGQSNLSLEETEKEFLRVLELYKKDLMSSK